MSDKEARAGRDGMAAPEGQATPEGATAEGATPEGATANEGAIADGPTDGAPEGQAQPDHAPAAEDVDADALVTAEPEAIPPVYPSDTSEGLELYFVRHADAGDPAEWAGDDADRPLSDKGRKQARRLGKLLDSLKFSPDVVLTSPKVRAAETARLLAKRVGGKARTDDRLSGGFDGQRLGELVSALDGQARRVVLVGHDPDFSDLVSWLSGFPIALRKGALAKVDLPDRAIGPGRAQLRWLVPPDAVPS